MGMAARRIRGVGRVIGCQISEDVHGILMRSVLLWPWCLMQPLNISITHLLHASLHAGPKEERIPHAAFRPDSVEFLIGSQQAQAITAYIRGLDWGLLNVTT
jgi:hypothetical protein